MVTTEKAGKLTQETVVTWIEDESLCCKCGGPHVRTVRLRHYNFGGAGHEGWLATLRCGTCRHRFYVILSGSDRAREALQNKIPGRRSDH